MEGSAPTLEELWKLLVSFRKEIHSIKEDVNGLRNSISNIENYLHHSNKSVSAHSTLNSYIIQLINKEQPLHLAMMMFTYRTH
jgi:hypothetical protein